MARIPPLKYVNTDSPELRQVQDSLQKTISAISGSTILDHSIITDVAVGTTDTYVNHKLTRPITGFIIINKNAATDVYQSTTANSAPGAHVILRASVAATVSIFFF